MLFFHVELLSCMYFEVREVKCCLALPEGSPPEKKKKQLQVPFGVCIFPFNALLCVQRVVQRWFCVLMLDTSLGFQHWPVCESLFLSFSILFNLHLRLHRAFGYLLTVRKF